MKKTYSAIVFIFLFFTQSVYAKDLKVHFINVGQGDSILVETPDDKTILIDAGKHNNTPQKYNPFIYLENHNVKKLDAVFITHPHDDHYNGLKYLCDSNGKSKKDFPVKAVYYSVEPGSKYGLFNDCFLELIQKSEEHGQVSSRGPPIAFGQVIFTVLYPEKPITSPSSNKNLDSIIMKMTYKNVSFMLTGDTEKRIEKTLEGDLSSTVLKVAHHAANTASGGTFLDEVNPKYAVISCNDKDYGNNYGHPHAVTLKSLKAKDVKVYRTDLSGTIVMQSDGEHIDVSAEKEISQDSPRLWRPGKKPNN